MQNVMLLLGSLAIAVQPAAGQQKSTKPPMAPPASAAACETLRSDWNRVEINLAQNTAAGIGDNSAPRASLREQEDANALARAAITLELMRAHQCPIPKRAPSAITYLTPALNCASARRTKGADAEECKTDNWTPTR